MPYLRSNLVALAPRLLRLSSLPCLHHPAYAEMVNMYYLTIVKTLRRQPFLIGVMRRVRRRRQFTRRDSYAKSSSRKYDR
jgi:hypothetical protein